MSTDQAISVLLLNGAIVFFVGMLVGLPYGIIRARQTHPESHDDWRISHTQNLQNGMLLLIVGLCAPYLLLSEGAMRAMVYLLVVAAYTDMAAWIVRPLSGHPGLLTDPPLANRAVFAFFGLTVVGQFAGFALVVYGAWARFAR